MSSSLAHGASLNAVLDSLESEIKRYVLNSGNPVTRFSHLPPELRNKLVHTVNTYLGSVARLSSDGSLVLTLRTAEAPEYRIVISIKEFANEIDVRNLITYIRRVPSIVQSLASGYLIQRAVHGLRAALLSQTSIDAYAESELELHLDRDEIRKLESHWFSKAQYIQTVEDIALQSVHSIRIDASVKEGSVKYIDVLDVRLDNGSLDALVDAKAIELFDSVARSVIGEIKQLPRISRRIHVPLALYVDRNDLEDVIDAVLRVDLGAIIDKSKNGAEHLGRLALSSVESEDMMKISECLNNAVALLSGARAHLFALLSELSRDIFSISMN